MNFIDNGSIFSKKKYNELILNAELDKAIQVDISEVNHNSEEGNRIVKYPDLVLHSSQGNDKDQKIICEIKRKDGLTPSHIFADLYKIGCYMNKDYFHSKRNPFEYGVFILVGERLSKIKSIKDSKVLIDKMNVDFDEFKNVFESFFQKIVCVSYDGNMLEYDTLEKLV